MNCVITAGPTYENLDRVRRLTNFSTGSLGSKLASFLSTQGHQVHLLMGEMATYHGEVGASSLERFTTTSDLLDRFKRLSGEGRVDAIFHAAAVSDFTFGKAWERLPNGEMQELKSGKLSTRNGTLLTELIPTPKIITQLRGLFANAKLVGWKYEVDGNRDDVLARATAQIRASRTDACVANGPAYGEGFGWLQANGTHEPLPDSTALFRRIDQFLAG